MSISSHAQREAAQPHPFSFRRTIAALSAFVFVGAVSGVVQLWFGLAAPPVSDLDALGLDSWRLPALWLLATVTIPCGVTCFAALRRRAWAPRAAAVAAVLLLIEVTVQIPFLGPSALQAIMGAVGLALLGLGLVASHRGSWSALS